MMRARAGGGSRAPRWTIAVALVALIVTFVARADAALVVECDEAYPLVGAAVSLTVLEEGFPVADAEVRAAYRPQSDVETVELVGRTDEAGRIRWTPTNAGLAILSATADGADDGSLTLSIRFDGAPTNGVLVMLVAGMILFGGAGYAMSRLLRRDPGPSAPST